MPPNGTSRKTPSAAAKPAAAPTFIPKALLEAGFTDGDRKGRLKLKSEQAKRLDKPTKPGSWDSDVLYSKPPIPSKLVSSPLKDIALSFTTGHPVSDRADIIKCNHCKRAILRHKAKSHIESCIAKKQEKQRKKKEAKDARDAAARKAERGGISSDSSDGEDEGPEGMTARKTARKSEGAQAGKKRKAEDVAAGGSALKKKKKDEPKAKAPKQKAPVDVERQCGVELAQGGQCARSLTCKSHSMGAKRAVPGRSAPYDKLLADYQRKNQAKMQKAAMENLALPDSDLGAEGPVDSDEEKDLVLAAIDRARPSPLFQPQLVPLRRRYAYVRLKEMLGNALGGKGAGGGGGLFGGGGGGGAGQASALQQQPPPSRGNSIAEGMGREASVVGRETSVLG